jgi:hypothetical protein
MPVVGDRVRLDARKVGAVAREGEVVAVAGPLLTIRWSTGEQSTMAPGPGSLTVVDPAPQQRAEKEPKSTKKAKKPHKKHAH